MKSLLKRAQPLLVAAAVVVFFGACEEQLDGGTACPILCPQQQVNLQDTTFFAVDLDTSIQGFPSLGSEIRFFVASLGDTLSTQAIVRFDSVPQFFRHINSVVDSVITSVDSASIRLTVVTGDTLAAPTTIEIYDVDQNGAEEADPTSVTTAFTPDRLLGSRTFPAAQLKDSARVFIDNAKLLEIIQRESPGNRLRIGVKVASTGNAKLTLSATNGGGRPELLFRASPDTAVPMMGVFPMSRTPANNPPVSAALADYQVVSLGPPPPAANVFRVGGIPGWRAYLRFAIPARILDSSNVVRATLLLNQTPSPGAPEPSDSVAIQQFRVVSSTAVTDIQRAMTLIQLNLGIDTLRLVGDGAGERQFEIISLVRAWAATSPDSTPRAMVLRSTLEGESARQVDFFSLQAPLAVRPRLRLTYFPRREDQIP